MLKDIFIDNNIAKNFSNPLDPEYKKLIRWLMQCDAVHPAANAYLVVSNKLIAEYQRTARNATLATSIPMVISQLTKEGRLIKISNQAIKDFQHAYFSKSVVKKLTCNYEDREHLPVVLLSQRKYALSLDDKFIADLEHFPGFVVLVKKRPEELPYAQ